MADTPQTLALLALGQQLRGEITATINRRSVALRALRLVPGAGQNVAWAVEGDGAVGESYDEGADASNYVTDTEAQALLNWGRVRSTWKISGSALRATSSAAAGPGGTTGKQARLARDIANATRKIASTVNGQIFTGTGANGQMTGLGIAIGSASNTYATIDRASASNWRPHVIDPGSSTALTFAQLRTDIGAIYDACGETPDLAFAPTAVFNTIAGLFDANRRWMTDKVGALNTPRGKVVLDAGYEGIEVDGCTFVKDKDAAAGSIYYLNTNYVEIEYLPIGEELLAELTDLMDKAGMMVPANDGFGLVPLGIMLEELAKTGDSRKFQALTELQLKVRRPNACGMRKNVATAS